MLNLQEYSKSYFSAAFQMKMKRKCFSISFIIFIKYYFFFYKLLQKTPILYINNGVTKILCCILTTIHSWIFCMNFKEKSRVILLKLSFLSRCNIIYLADLHVVAVAVAQWVRVFARKRKVGCSNPSRDRPKSLKQVVTAPLPNAWHQCECHGSSEMTIINGYSVSQQVWHSKEPSLLNGHKCRTQVKRCSPSAAMVTDSQSVAFQTEWSKYGRNKKKSIELVYMLNTPRQLENIYSLVIL